VALTVAALLVGSTIAFAQQQTAPTQSTQPATNGAADPLAAIGQHPATPTTDDIRQARFERLERMDALRGQTPPSNTVLDRSATTSLLTSAQRQTMLRSLDTAAAYAGYPHASTRPVEPATPPTSGLDAQAQSRRSGEAQEPVTTP
jgi:hypothetical protein